jgi:CubicO group peptidase (beta-lactamase class C family)
MEHKHPTELGFSTERLERVGLTAEGYIERGEVSGVVVAIARGGAIGYLRAYGSRGRAPPSTQFWIDPEEEIAAVLLLQRVPGFSSGITDDLYTGVYQSLID